VGDDLTLINPQNGDGHMLAAVCEDPGHPQFLRYDT
jgi:hypothetical protein